MQHDACPVVGTHVVKRGVTVSPTPSHVCPAAEHRARRRRWGHSHRRYKSLPPRQEAGLGPGRGEIWRGEADGCFQTGPVRRFVRHGQGRLRASLLALRPCVFSFLAGAWPRRPPHHFVAAAPSVGRYAALSMCAAHELPPLRLERPALAASAHIEVAVSVPHVTLPHQARAGQPNAEHGGLLLRSGLDLRPARVRLLGGPRLHT